MAHDDKIEPTRKTTTRKTTTRRTRANGRESRRRIIEAAAAVAGERGYEGTSIARISKASGLPASSIYWHFKDKDALLAAVVAEGVELWLGQVTQTDGSSLPEKVMSLSRGVARALTESPDFQRLGVMLALEKRPDQTAGREIFLRLRGEAVEAIAQELHKARPGLSSERAHRWRWDLPGIPVRRGGPGPDVRHPRHRDDPPHRAGRGRRPSGRRLSRANPVNGAGRRRVESPPRDTWPAA